MDPLGAHDIAPKISAYHTNMGIISLYEFVDLYRDEIIRRCRVKVANRSAPPPTEAEIDHGVPLFLEQLLRALHREPSSSQEIRSSAGLHGHELRRQGLTISQVVHDYGDVCQSITDLAVEINAPIGTDDFRTLNRCLDDAIASAVDTFGHEGHQAALDQSIKGNERLGFFSHELRNLTNTAIVAFEVLKSGNVGPGGSTGAVLHRSLMGLRTLIARSLDEVRLTQGVHKVPFLVSAFISELAPTALLEANARGIGLTVLPGTDDVVIDADRQVLAAVVMNLLQNAFKFTRPQTTVVLRVVTTTDRVIVEVQDECGGLPEGDMNELFLTFAQRSPDRTGLGLGLAFSRWAVEANEGHLSVQNTPHAGCVFRIDLPRLFVPAAGMV